MQLLSAKNHACFACSVVNALATASRRYQFFAVDRQELNSLFNQEGHSKKPAIMRTSLESWLFYWLFALQFCFIYGVSICLLFLIFGRILKGTGKIPFIVDEGWICYDKRQRNRSDKSVFDGKDEIGGRNYISRDLSLSR